MISQMLDQWQPCRSRRLILQSWYRKSKQKKQKKKTKKTAVDPSGYNALVSTWTLPKHCSAVEAAGCPALWFI